MGKKKKEKLPEMAANCYACFNKNSVINAQYRKPGPYSIGCDVCQL